MEWRWQEMEEWMKGREMEVWAKGRASEAYSFMPLSVGMVGACAPHSCFSTTADTVSSLHTLYALRNAGLLALSAIRVSR
jgi:hypothetical protein